jgi:hypothetical protein
MSPAQVGVVLIGSSHLLQPPVTLWLAKRVLGLESAFSALPPLANRIAKIMALTAIMLPTLLGVLCALYSGAVLSLGPMRLVAFVLAGLLWTPRLVAQLVWVSPHFPADAWKWHVLLVSIFAVQGPGLLLLLVFGTR